MVFETREELSHRTGDAHWCYSWLLCGWTEQSLSNINMKVRKERGVTRPPSDNLQVAKLWIELQYLPQAFISASIRQILMTGEMWGMQRWWLRCQSDAASRHVFVTFFILASSLIVFLLSLLTLFLICYVFKWFWELDKPKQISPALFYARRENISRNVLFFFHKSCSNQARTCYYPLQMLSH